MGELSFEQAAIEVAQRQFDVLNRLAEYERGETYEQLYQEVDHAMAGFLRLVTRKSERIAELERQLGRVITVTDNILNDVSEAGEGDPWVGGMCTAARLVNRAIAGGVFETEGGDRG